MPLSDRIEEIRSDMGNLRSRIQNLAREFPNRADNLRDAEGLMTCGISALYATLESARRDEKYEAEKKARKDAEAKASGPTHPLGITKV